MRRLSHVCDDRSSRQRLRVSAGAEAHRMRTAARLVLLVGIAVASQCVQLAEADPSNDKPIREIFVPFDDLNVLLQGDADRAFLTREEYQDLITKAKQTRSEHAPRNTLLLSADYDLTIQQQRASIRGMLSLEVFEPGLHAVPLELSGVGIRTAMSDGVPAPLGRNQQGQVVLFVEGIGRRQLELDLVTSLQTSAAQQSLQFTLPTPAATRLRLTVPGNVELRSGAAVVSRSLDQETGVTRFELLPQRGPLSLVLSLNNKLLLERRVVMARSVIVDEVTQAYERLHTTTSLAVLHGAVDQFRFRIPAGFEITAVDAPILSRWLVIDEGGTKTLEVDLREAATGTVVLNISAIKHAVSLQDWLMPYLVPLDVDNHVAVVGILIEDRLAADSIAAGELISIDNEVLRRALPESVFQVDPGAPRVRPVAAFYAPRDQFQLTARFTRPPASVDAHTVMLLTVGEQQQHLQGTITLVPQHEKLFSYVLAVPNAWRVAAISAEDGSPISFEQVAVAEDGGARLNVRLPAGVAPGAVAKSTIEATSVPEGWLEDWAENKVGFPVFVVENATTTTGAIAVQSRDDLVTRPDQVNGLTILGDSDRKALGLDDAQGTLFYRITDADHSASFAVERVKPQVIARAFNFLKIEPEGLTAHYELVYDVRHARTRKLRFHLPESTPASLSVRGLDSTQVKEYSSELADGQRQWTASLANAVIGQVRLAIDFEQPLKEDEPQAWELPLARAMDVAYQSSIVAVEGSPEFETQLRSNGRKVDVGELVDADYQVGQRLLGTFGFIGDPQVTVDLQQRIGYGLPAAITQRAELVTLVSAGGTSQTAARYLLKTKAAYLQISLPQGATLWSASVDGKPSTPQRDGEDLVISLPPTSGGALRDLQIVYESATSAIHWMADVEAVAPRLVVRMESRDERYDVPTADVLWHLVLPEGHRIVRSQGTVFKHDLPRTDTIASVVRHVFSALGGVGKFGILPGVFLSARQTAPAATASVGDRVQYFAEGAEVAADSEMDFSVNEPAAPLVIPQEEAKAATAPPGLADGEAAADRQQAQTPSRDQPGGSKNVWALQGVRSLQIELERSGQQVTVAFQSMGVRPSLRVTLLHAHRLAFLSWALAVIVTVWGIAKTNHSVRGRTRFVLAAIVLSFALPQVIGLFLDLDVTAEFVPMLYASLLLVPYYLVASFAGWIAAVIVPRRRAAVVTATAALFVAISASTVCSQEQGFGPSVDPAELLMLLQPGEPVKLPDDAVIIPYDPSDENGVESAKKVLVPYAEYTRLWNLAFPDKSLDAKQPPAPYALSGAAYEAALAGEDYLLIQGRMDVNVYQQSPIEIPLHLAGGVFERATLDGEPAKLRIIAPDRVPADDAPANAQMQRAARAREVQPESITVLHVASPGKKRLEVAVRLPIQRSGGWRIVRGQLPMAPATQLTLTIPDQKTELRLSGTLDRASFETQEPNETIATALPSNGGFSLQWRPTVAAGLVDQTLTARSLGILDIQEDGVRLVWQLELQTRNSQRETFSFILPEEYLVEQVHGENVRGWQSRGSGDQQQLDVTLLKAATGTETITLRLSRRSVIGLDGPTGLVAPAVSVPDAMLHQGQLAIRRSPLLDVRTERASGVSRVEIADESMASVLGFLDEESPLGLKPFEAYRFGSSTYQLELSASAYASRISVEERTVLRIGDRETTVESRMKFTISDRPAHQLELVLPHGLELKEVVAPGSFEWAITSIDDQRLLTVYLASGAVGTLDLDLRGSVPREPSGVVTNPRFVVPRAVGQAGYIVVQVDPALDVVVDQSANIEEVPSSRVVSWLVEQQQALARLVMFHRSAEYSASFRVSPRQPKVNSFSVTNVRVTPREIEELVFIKFSVRDAGIREVSFSLPESLRDAQITVPMLRQKTITPDVNVASRIRVRLELQDQVIDELIVLVQNSRSLTASDYAVPVPAIETGITDFRYVVIESAGRDEVVVTNNQDFLELNRQLSQWRQLAQILPGQMTQAYVARDGAENPQLSLATRQRATVETAGASIGLGESLLLVDASGAYRGRQEYRIDNKTEPFLEIDLPDGAELWTALVAGEAVKPTVVPNAPRGRVRVPLVKTQMGDLDYSVILKYGGDLKRPRMLRQVSFPLMRTINIKVQQSHVRLRLPESQHWFNFTGSMRHVTDPGELAADYVSYQTKQVERLMQVINSESFDAFSQVRAKNNVRLQVEQAEQQRQSLLGELDGASDSERLQRELMSNYGVVQEAERQLQQSAQTQPEVEYFGNSYRFRQLYESQAANRAKDVVSDLDNNFDATSRKRGGEIVNGQQSFNDKWFDKNQLGKSISGGKEADIESRIAAGPSPPPVSKPALGLEAEFFKSKGQLQQLQDEQLQKKLSDEVSQVERYQRRLETLNESQQLGRAAQAMPHDSSDLRQRGDFAAPINEGFAGRRGTAGSMGGGGFGGGSGTAADDILATAGVPTSAGEAGLTSLDVALPERGVEYLFTTPRGDIQITARSVDRVQQDRVLGLLGVVAALVGLCLVYRIGAAIVSSISRRTLALVMILLGVVSVVLGVLPVLGIIVIIWGVATMIRPAARPAPATTS